MPLALTDTIVKSLACPATGNKITYDTKGPPGFGIRVTSGGARSFIIGYRTRTGRERRYTIGSASTWKVAAARAEAIEIKRKVDVGEDPLGEIADGRAEPTVQDLCTRFSSDFLPRKRASTQAAYQSLIDQYIVPALGRLKVSEVEYANVDALHRAITQGGAPYRANRAIATLSKMFSLSVRWGLRDSNPCKGIERNQEHKRKRYLSGPELARLTAALATHKDRAAANIIRLLLLTGARRSEVLKARWAEIDLDAGMWRKDATGTKQRQDHHIPVSEAAVTLLRALDQSGEFVFPAGSGGHRASVAKPWTKICEEAGIKGARVHDLRHSYASVLASAGLSLPIIGRLLGHSSPTTTARYAHLADDPLRLATQRAADIIDGRPTAEVVPLKRPR